MTRAVTNLQIAEFALQGDRDIKWAGQRARLLGSLAGATQRRCQMLGKAVRHVAGHALQRAPGGTISFRILGHTSRTLAEVEVRYPSAAMTSDPAREETAGAKVVDSELSMAAQCVDEFLVTSDPSDDTAVRMQIVVPVAASSLSPSMALHWAEVLTSRTTQGALATGHQRIRELAEQLERAQSRSQDLEVELRQIKSLNETLELLALVASKTDNAVIIMDAQGIVEWVNDGFVRITGYESSAVRGKPIAEILHGPLTADEDRRLIQQSLHASQGMSQEIENQRKDGQPYWAAVSITPVFNEQGRTTRWIGIANDITRRRHAQEELRKAKEAAEAANRSKSEFLANISHEIRTPMNAVIGMTALALDTSLTSEQREYLSTAKDSAESLLRLLNDVLDLSKIEARRLELEHVAFQLQDVVRDAYKSLVTQARKKGLQFFECIDADVPAVVVGDPARLRQILINLLDNAIKFTESGEVRIRVKLQWKASDAVGLQFTVQDTGVGIPGDKLRTVFEAFTQADSSTTRRYGGTGLGLTISCELVRMMEGRIWVESEVGQGSAFHVSLRFLTASSPVPPVREQAATGPRLLQARHRLAILIADDNWANRTLAARILEKRGHRIVQAQTGREAVSAVERERFDIVLMDVQMPDMDGFESTAIIRQREQTKGGHLPVVAMTAYAMKGDRDRCLRAGMDAYIAKPLRAPELRWLVECLACAEGDDAGDPRATGDSFGGHRFGPALQRLEGDVEIFKEQIEFFLHDSPRLVEDVQNAIAVSDLLRLQVTAHRLKGLAATFDDQATVAAADQLEQIGRERGLEQAADACQTLQAHLFRLQRGLWQFLREH